MQVRSKLLLALVTFLCSGVGYFWLTPFALSDVEISYAACDMSTSSEPTVDSGWEGPKYLLSISQPENCGLGIQSVAVQRLGPYLFVRTSFSKPSELTSCFCQHRTSLRIQGLPQSDYRLKVYSWP
jgi:hypothetical protein